MKAVPLLLTACLPNRTAVATSIWEKQCETVWIVGSGWEGDYSLEDSLAAGAVADALLAIGTASQRPARIANDEMYLAPAVWHQWAQDNGGCLRAASHGQRLMGIGNHDADFACCAAVDSLQIVPFQADPGVLKAS